MNKKNNSYDVVIVGAGPAGLSIGSELSKEFRVLVVDRRPNPNKTPTQPNSYPKNDVVIENQARTSKSWFVPWDSVTFNPDILKQYSPYSDETRELTGLSPAYGGVRRFLAKTFNGLTRDDPNAFDLEWNAKLFKHEPYPRPYPYIDEDKIIDYWRGIISGGKNGSEIVYEHFFRDLKVTKDKVTISFLKKTEGGETLDEHELVTVTSKLLLDASGVDSGILKYYEIQPTENYWWSVYGCLGKHKEGQIGKGVEGPEHLKVGDYMLWQTFRNTNIDENESVRYGRPIFEYEILTDSTSLTLILFLRKEKVCRDFMKAEFMDIIRNEESTKDFHEIEIQEYKYGWYPSGGLPRKNSKNRVDFIGDTGTWTTPCGWGMGFIMQNYKAYAKGLSQLIREDNLSQDDLKDLIKLKWYQRTQFLMNRLATFFLSNGNADQLNKFIQLFNEIDPVICEAIFTLKIRPHEIVIALWGICKKFTLKELIHIVPKDERLSILIDLVYLGFEMIYHVFIYLKTGQWSTDTRNFKIY